MRTLWLALGGFLAATLILFLATNVLYAQALLPRKQPGAMPTLEINRTLTTVTTTRVGSDDPVETATLNADAAAQSSPPLQFPAVRVRTCRRS